MDVIKKQLSSMKSTIKSGKHIDKFFDTLIQNIIQLHNNIKETYRSQINDKIKNKWEKYE